MNPSHEQVQRGSEQSTGPQTAGFNGEGGPVEPGQPADTPAAARGALGLWDAVSIIVGIVVGAGIYQTAPFIFKHVDSPRRP